MRGFALVMAFMVAVANASAQPAEPQLRGFVRSGWIAGWLVSCNAAPEIIARYREDTFEDAHYYFGVTLGLDIIFDNAIATGRGDFRTDLPPEFCERVLRLVAWPRTSPFSAPDFLDGPPFPPVALIERARQNGFLAGQLENCEPSAGGSLAFYTVVRLSQSDGRPNDWYREILRALVKASADRAIADDAPTPLQCQALARAGRAAYADVLKIAPAR